MGSRSRVGSARAPSIVSAVRKVSSLADMGQVGNSGGCNMRRLDFVDLVKASLLPREYVCAPSGVNADPDPPFLKRFDVTGNFTVGAAPIDTSSVPTSTGAVMWFPGRDGGSVYRFGLVTPHSFNADWVQNAGGIAVFSWSSPVAIPYNTIVPDDIVTISPARDWTNFSRVRTVAGSLRMTSDTIPIGNAAYNGQLCVSALSDVRDALLVGAVGVDSYHAPPAITLPYAFPNTVPGITLDPSTLVQAAVTSKDGIKQVSGINGVRTVLGPDVSTVYGPADMTQCDYPLGGELYNDYLEPCFPSGVGYIPLAPYNDAVQLVCWVSAWNTQMSAIDPSIWKVVNNRYYRATSPFDVLDISLRFGITATGGDQDGDYDEQWNVQFMHVFASCSSGNTPVGQISYQWCTEEVTLGTQTRTAGKLMSFSAQSHPRMIQRDIVGDNTPSPATTPYISPTGMYIGTLVTVVNTNIGTIAATAGTTSYIVNDTTSRPIIDVRPRNMFSPGNLGPCRILKYDGFTQGMLLRMDGTYLMQSLAGQTMAPFVQQGLSTSDTMLSASSLMELAALYENPNSPFARSYNIKEYDEFAEKVRNLSMGDIRHWMPKCNSKRDRSDDEAEDSD
jgi:hypothetical protein